MGQAEQELEQEDEHWSANYCYYYCYIVFNYFHIYVLRRTLLSAKKSRIVQLLSCHGMMLLTALTVLLLVTFPMSEYLTIHLALSAASGHALLDADRSGAGGGASLLALIALLLLRLYHDDRLEIIWG